MKPKNFVKPIISHAQEMKERRARQRDAVPTTYHKKIFKLTRQTDGVYLRHKNKYILSGLDANVKQPQDVIWE